MQEMQERAASARRINRPNLRFLFRQSLPSGYAAAKGGRPGLNLWGSSKLPSLTNKRAPDPSGLFCW